jgi:hypothetical protein
MNDEISATTRSVWVDFSAQHGRPNVTLGGDTRALRKVNAGGEDLKLAVSFAGAGMSNG